MEEVAHVVQEIPNNKAPSPDGLTIYFFKACWKVVTQDVFVVIEESRDSSTILKALNSNFIALIPK